MAKTHARLMNKPDDYKRFGLEIDKIAPWEDSRRSEIGPNCWEWWYFDGIMDDGTAIVIQFFVKPVQEIRNKKDVPAINFQITLPDGTHHSSLPVFTAEQSFYGKEKCDVHFGDSYFVGDLKEYDIFVAPTDGISARLHIDSLSKPFRPGTAYFDFDGKGDTYYTWFCSMPKGEVSGTITVDGKEINVHGFGYHDHQWGNFLYVTGWNHWVWARQRFEDYTLILFDKYAAKSMGGTHIPLCYLEDSNGDIIFSNTDDAHATVDVLDEYTDSLTGKIYPKKIHYTFKKDGKTLDYILEETKILEAPDTTKALGKPMKALLSLKGLNPSYARYLANGKMTFTDATGVSLEREEPLIYEFMYPGKSYK